MSSIITLSISEPEIYELLKKEINKSALVTSLLREYYHKHYSKEVIKEYSIQELIELRKAKELELQKERDDFNKDNKIEKLNLELNELNSKEKELLTIKEDKEKDEKQKVIYRKNFISGLIKENCNIEEDEINGLVDLFEIERKDYTSLYDWLEAKRIPLKEKFEFK